MTLSRSHPAFGGASAPHAPRAHGPVARVAVAGCGAWGRNLVRDIHELGALAALCDTDAGAANALGERFGVPVAPFAEALADPDIDAVMIATPAVTHARLVAAALKAGKHVFVEKPLALAVAEAQALAALARETGRVLMVGHLLQYHPAFLALKTLVDDGALGAISYLSSTRLNLGKVRREENILWSFAPHDVSMILALAGGRPETVSANGAAYLQDRVNDVTTTHIGFSNGATAHIFVSWLHPVKEQRLVVVGERAMAVFDDGLDWGEKLRLYRHRIDWSGGQPAPSRAPPEPVVLEPAPPLRVECAHFLDCVATGRRPRTDAAEGIRVLAVLEAAQRSIDEGQPRRLADESPRALEIEAHPSAVIDDGVEIGAGTRIWHFSHILSGTRIGRDCVIGQNVMIGPSVIIGDGCRIQNNVSLYKGVTLEDGVFCGPSAVFTNVATPRAGIDRRDEFRPTPVGRGATIGANATIVCGHRLGAYCLVAAGAVVTRDVPPFALVAGVPARRVGWVGHAGERLGPDLICPREGRRYRQTSPDTLEEIVTDA